MRASPKPDRGGGLPLAGRRRGDGGDQDQLAVGLVFQGVDEVEGDLRLGGAVGDDSLGGYSGLGGYLDDRLHLGFARNFDVGFDHGCSSPEGFGVFLVRLKKCHFLPFDKCGRMVRKPDWPRLLGANRFLREFPSGPARFLRVQQNVAW